MHIARLRLLGAANILGAIVNEAFGRLKVKTSISYLWAGSTTLSFSYVRFFGLVNRAIALKHLMFSFNTPVNIAFVSLFAMLIKHKLLLHFYY